MIDALLPRLQEAETLLNQDNPKGALTVLEAPTNEPPPGLPPYEQLRWHWLLGTALLRSSRREESLPVLERGLALAERLRPYVLVKQEELFDALTERVRIQLGSYYYGSNKTWEALRIHRQCLLAITNGVLTNKEVQMQIYRSLGTDYVTLGQQQAAISFLEQALKLANDLNNEREQALIRWPLAQCLKDLGDYEQARKYYQDALNVAEARVDENLLIPLRAMLGQVLIELHELPRAEWYLTQAVRGADRSNNAYFRGATRGNMALLHIAREQFDEAIHLLREALDILKGSTHYQTTGQLYLSLAKAYQGKQQPAEAEQAFRNALAELAHIEDDLFRIRAHEQFSAFLADQGNYQDAIAQLEAVRALKEKRKL